MRKKEIEELNETLESEEFNFKKLLKEEFEGTNDYKYDKIAVVRISDPDCPTMTTFPSISEAARITAIKKGGTKEDLKHNIRECLQGKRKTAAGYVWRVVTKY